MIQIDGSYGEGGGQILRTCLSLSAITGQPLKVVRIRAGRKHPGLAAQHLTSVRATADICQAQLAGDELGSMTLEFIPAGSPQAGHYTVDVSQARQGGSAGSVTLIMQAILMPLALASGRSQVTLRGGTHVSWSPPVTYIQEVYLPAIAQLGIRAELELRAWGWYPQGGGEVTLRVAGNSSVGYLDLLDRGALQQVRGLAVSTELPAHIPQRMASRAENLLRQAHLPGQVNAKRERGRAPGTGIFLTAEYERSRAGFSALGRRGLPAERVAEMAVEEMLEFHNCGMPVDAYLADQLLLPAALGSQTSQYRVARVTPHLRTNAWAIAQFGLAQIAIDEENHLVTVVPEGSEHST
ncbi:MAG: RNA 3'-terminal phosphate cyclase [Synechococcus sp.]